MWVCAPAPSWSPVLDEVERHDTAVGGGWKIRVRWQPQYLTVISHGDIGLGTSGHLVSHLWSSTEKRRVSDAEKLSGWQARRFRRYAPYSGRRVWHSASRPFLPGNRLDRRGYCYPTRSPGEVGTCARLQYAGTRRTARRDARRF